jgi:hypothetical protein
MDLLAPFLLGLWKDSTSWWEHVAEQNHSTCKAGIKEREGGQPPTITRACPNDRKTSH